MTDPDMPARKIALPNAGSAGLRGLVLPVLLVLGWVAVSKWQLGNPAVFVPVEDIAGAFRRLVANGDLPAALVGTIWRGLLGFAIGAAAGLLVGLLLGLYLPLARSVGPLFHALRQIALFAWMPLITAWLGNGEVAKIALIALGAFFPVALNTETGVRGVPEPWLELARLSEFGTFERVRRIILPAAMPSIVAGIELGLTIAWLGTIGAEYLLASGAGLGVLLAAARELGRMDQVLVGVITLGLIGFLLARLIDFVNAKVFKWRPASQ